MPERGIPEEEILKTEGLLEDDTLPAEAEKTKTEQPEDDFDKQLEDADRERQERMAHLFRVRDEIAEALKNEFADDMSYLANEFEANEPGEVDKSIEEMRSLFCNKHKEVDQGKVVVTHKIDPQLVIQNFDKMPQEVRDKLPGELVSVISAWDFKRDQIESDFQEKVRKIEEERKQATASRLSKKIEEI